MIYETHFKKQQNRALCEVCTIETALPQANTGQKLSVTLQQRQRKGLVPDRVWLHVKPSCKSMVYGPLVTEAKKGRA